MRLYYLLILLLLLSCKHPQADSTFLSNGRKAIQVDDTLEEKGEETILPMHTEHGVRYVWIRINGNPMEFIFDTGASSICISIKEAANLYKEGTLEDEDILGTQRFQDATGYISEGMLINLKEVRISDRIIRNVKAVVVDNTQAPLLLGQSVLEQFGSITIDNNNQKIIFK